MNRHEIVLPERSTIRCVDLQPCWRASCTHGRQQSQIWGGPGM